MSEKNPLKPLFDGFGEILGNKSNEKKLNEPSPILSPANEERKLIFDSVHQVKETKSNINAILNELSTPIQELTMPREANKWINLPSSGYGCPVVSIHIRQDLQEYKKAAITTFGKDARVWCMYEGEFEDTYCLTEIL